MKTASAPIDVTSPTRRPGRKVDQVIAGAREVFLEHGFEGASVDEIARAAGVSKATLYSYFADKRLLFLEVAKAECQAQADRAVARIEASGDVREVLRDAAGRMVRFFMSPVGMQVYRIVVGESQRFPEIGREFYESGPSMVRSLLTGFLDRATTEGKLTIEDVPLAADQFCELCKAGMHIKMALGLRDAFTDAEIDRVVDGAVEMFMARYSAD